MFCKRKAELKAEEPQLRALKTAVLVFSTTESSPGTTQQQHMCTVCAIYGLLHRFYRCWLSTETSMHRNILMKWCSNTTALSCNEQLTQKAFPILFSASGLLIFCSWESSVFNLWRAGVTSLLSLFPSFIPCCVEYAWCGMMGNNPAYGWAKKKKNCFVFYQGVLLCQQQISDGDIK